MVFSSSVLAAITFVIFMAFLKLWILLARFIVSVFTINLEEKVLKPLAFTHSFPRNRAETLKNPEKLFKILVSQGVIGKACRFKRIKELKAIDTEPDKNATSLAIEIEYSNSEAASSTGEETRSKKVFVKFQTGKGMPIWLQALRAAAEPGVVREVDFYNKLSKSVPIHTPKVYYAGKLPHFNLVFIVLEHVNLSTASETSDTLPSYEVIPDNRFDSKVRMTNMLKQVATMHGQFLGRTALDERTKWIPAQKGLKYCEWVRTMGNKSEPKEYYDLFKALESHFQDYSLTLVHGDCRPGNMMFNKTDQADIIFADFEAVNVAPPLWDFTYATVIGLPVETRRSSQLELLASYYEALKASVDPSAKNHLRTLDQYKDDVILLTVVLYYVSRTVTKGGFWENQGNTEEDLNSWGERVSSSIQDISSNRVAELLNVDVSIVDKVKSLS